MPCAAGREDHAGALVPHQRVGAFERGVGDALDDVFRRARFERRAIQQIRRLAGAAHRVRMRAEHDGVAGLERNQNLVNRGGGRIGGGQNGGHHAHRHADIPPRALPAVRAARRRSSCRACCAAAGRRTAGSWRACLWRCRSRSLRRPARPDGGRWRAPPRPCARQSRPPAPGCRCGISARPRRPFRPWSGPPESRRGLYLRASAERLF